MRRRLVVGAIVALLVALGAWWLGVGRAAHFGRYAIYVTDVATRAATLWRSAPGRDLWAPAWSPDGTMIAWHETTGNDAPADLMVAAVDGTGVRRVTGGSHAAWSPDSKQMAFEAQLDDPGNFDIYVIDLATGATRRISSDPALDWAPSWSPDGRWIGFTSRRSGADQLYVIDASSGAGERAITSGPGRAVRLQWSPDGQRVAFGSSRTGNADIFVADPDGTNAMAITTSPADDWDPAWSPDGQKIAFLSYRDNGVASLYVMDAGGRNPIRLSNDAYRESGGFTWSPDGRSIVHAAAPRLPGF